MIKQELNGYSDALAENTKSIQRLTEIMIRHDEMLQQEQKSNITRNAILTGIAVGVVVLLVDGLVHLI